MAIINFCHICLQAFCVSVGIGLLSGLVTYLRYRSWDTKTLTPGNLPHYYIIIALMLPVIATLIVSLGQYKLVSQSSSIFPIVMASSCIASLITTIFYQYVLNPKINARHYYECGIKTLLIFCTLMTVATTLAIILSILFESIRFFSFVPLSEFIFGTHWSPHNAEGSVYGHFGAISLFLGSIIITVISLCISGPIGLFSAIYMTFYAPAKLRHILKPVLEMLAGIPTVVYGFFAIIFVAPMIRKTGALFGLSIATESALVAGLVMGIMTVPFISSLTDDVLTALPHSLRDGALGLGATFAETIRHVMLPAAFPGIASSFLLAMSRAIGETMLVVMAAGMSANLTLNPIEPVTTVTVQIVSILTGDQEFNTPKTLAAFALGLCLFIMTFILNYIAFRVVQRYRRLHEAH